MDKQAEYIHGTEKEEQERLALLNRLTNGPFLEFLNLRGNEEVLEVGSGLGLLTADVAMQLPNGSAVGLEYSQEQLAIAKTRESGNLSFRQGDAHDLPFEDGSFDIAYCRYVLEHVAQPGTVLREMHRVLKPGERALAQENNDFAHEFYPVCPAFDHVWRQFIVLQGQLGGDALIGKKLFSLFKEAGFVQIELSLQPEVHWSGSPNFEAWVTNIIGNLNSAKTDLTEHGLANASEVEAARDELKELMRRDDASAIFYWNRAVGFKR